MTESINRTQTFLKPPLPLIEATAIACLLTASQEESIIEARKLSFCFPLRASYH